VLLETRYVVRRSSTTASSRVLTSRAGTGRSPKNWPQGYANYLEATINDADREYREQMIAWRGPGFDPNIVDETAIERRSTKFASRRRRKTKAAL
jgi:hypothetical protein